MNLDGFFTSDCWMGRSRGKAHRLGQTGRTPELPARTSALVPTQGMTAAQADRPPARPRFWWSRQPQRVDHSLRRFGGPEERRRAFSVRRFWWAGRLWVDRLGLAGVAGLGLAVFALVFGLSAMLSLQAEHAQLLDELDTSRERLAQAQQAAADPPRSPSEQLAAFYDMFPPAHSLPETLRTLSQLATAQHLVLRAGNYHVTDDHTGQLVRFEVMLPIEGAYPDVRRFIRAVLAKMPNAALDKLDVEKSPTDGSKAMTVVHFTLFTMRGTP